MWHAGALGAGWAATKGSSSEDARRVGRLPSLASSTYDYLVKWPRRAGLLGVRQQSWSVQLWRSLGRRGEGWTVSKGSSSEDARRTGRLPPLGSPSDPAYGRVVAHAYDYLE